MIVVARNHVERDIVLEDVFKSQLEAFAFDVFHPRGVEIIAQRNRESGIYLIPDHFHTRGGRLFFPSRTLIEQGTWDTTLPAPIAHDKKS